MIRPAGPLVLVGRGLAGILLGVVARAWLWSLRLHVEIHPSLADRSEPWVLSFFHGTQWPLLAWKRRRPTLVMVSHSKDGHMQARALGVLGLRVVRGSSSRGGARALAAMIRGLRTGGCDAAFAVDGPRGPYGVVKEGAAVAAARSGGLIVPMGSAVVRGKVFLRAWDRFVLAWPFSRVVVVLGAPVPASADLAVAISCANERASEILRSSGVRSLNVSSGSSVEDRGALSSRLGEFDA